jgi:RNA polymerase sigma-70 factor (ECF subfamily)
MVVDDAWRSINEELRSFLRSRVPCQADVDDLLQDVFLRVSGNVESLRDARRIDAWVYQIARNAIADYYRRRSRSDEPVEDVAAVDCPGNGPENKNESVAAWLPQLIEALPSTLQGAVRLSEIEGLSQAETARRLGISLSGAKSRVQRGRRRLEELIREHCRIELDRRGNVITCEPTRADACGSKSCGCTD